MGIPITVTETKILGELTDILRVDRALADAEKIAGRKGHVMTIPQLIDVRLKFSLDDPIWGWVCGLSAEYHGLDKGRNQLYAVAHGKGPLLKSSRLKKAIKSPEWLPYGYARLSDREFAQVVKDAVPLEEVRGKNPKVSEAYTLAGKVKNMKINPSGMVSIDNLRTDDRFLMALGSEERRHAYLDKIEKELHWVFYGNKHRIGDVNFTISQGRPLVLGYDNIIGLIGSNFMGDGGRFAVAREHRL